MNMSDRWSGFWAAFATFTAMIWLVFIITLLRGNIHV